jgi:hypothetical protein
VFDEEAVSIDVQVGMRDAVALRDRMDEAIP